MTFKELGITEPILRALEEEGYTRPTPIQEQSIPILLQGKDLLGCAQTGTGKTAAFAIPILQHLFLNQKREKGRRKIKALVVTPTRELALQIGEGFNTYGKYTGVKTAVIFGGVKQNPQTDALYKGVDVLVATPGRLLDLIGQGYISLKEIGFSVLDEADHMLDMGFIHDIRKIIELLPRNRQSLFFSATMPPAIMDLSKKILGSPERVTIKPEQATAERVDQTVYFVSKSEKSKLLVHLLQKKPNDSVLIFSRTKHGADKIVKILRRSDIGSEAIHGNKTQTSRQRALGNFKSGRAKVLVATDIAARGIDVEELALVVNYDLPNVSETYIHRIGRTGRASASGQAISFCSADERSLLRDIQKLIRQQVQIVENHPFVESLNDRVPVPPSAAIPANRNQGRHARPNATQSSDRNKRRRYYSGKRN